MIERPEGFENEKRDCSVRALSIAADLPYLVVHLAFKQAGRKDGHGTPRKLFKKVIKILNLKAVQVKRTGSVKSFINKFPTGRYYCSVRNHAFSVINGEKYDIENLKQHIKGAWRIEKI